MRDIWNYHERCGCVLGHAKHSVVFRKTPFHRRVSKTLFGIPVYDGLWDFLFSSDWVDYDNTPEGAVGRLDAVIDGLRF